MNDPDRHPTHRAPARTNPTLGRWFAALIGVRTPIILVAPWVLAKTLAH